MTATDVRVTAPADAGRVGRPIGPLLLAVLFVLAVVAAFLLPQWGVLTPDTKPELYLDPSGMLGRELSAWRPGPFLGSPNYHPGIAPITAVVWGLQQLGLAPWAAQRVLAIGLTLLASAGAWLLVRRMTGRAGMVPVVAGIAYAIHPYAVVAGATLPIRLPHAVLPWFVLAAALALRGGGWRWAAATALTYAAMGGINGGIVNILLGLALPVVAIFVFRTERPAVPVLLRRLVVIGGLCLMVSLYWLVPTLLAVGSTATDVAAATEAPEAVAGTSSPIESLRGLGMWTLYLVIGGRPELPGHVSYLTNGWLVASSLLLPVLAAVGVAVTRARLRLLAGGLIVASLPIMVGLYPPDDPTPLGRFLAWSFEHVPGAVGFRTPNKAGSLLALGVAVLIGFSARGRFNGRSLAPLVLGVVALAALPLWLGEAQPVRLDVPEYWRKAASELDHDTDGRLLFAPGAFLARYDWGYDGVDDLDAALFDRRDVVWRPTVPAGSRPAHNLLTAFDVSANSGSLSPESAAAYLSLLGVSDVLVRADSANTRDGAATAEHLLATYTDIDGAAVAEAWGPLVVPSAPLGASVPAPMPALTHVSLPDSSPLGVMPLTDSLVVVGDSFAIGTLADAGYQPAGRALSWLDTLSTSELQRRIDAGGRVVVTDTNQRRRWDIRGVDRAYSTVLPPGERLEGAATRARTLDPETQTSAFYEGGVGITSSDADPGLFRAGIDHPPSFAADGDPNTAWVSGAFGTESASWIRLDYGEAVALDPVRILVDTSRDRIPSRLRIRAEELDVVVDVPQDGEVQFRRFADSSWLRVDVLAARGEGSGPIGLTDISLAGRSIRAGMALPSVFGSSQGDDVRSVLSGAPFDVLLSRMQGDPASGTDDEERNLFREFTLPDDRELTVRATVRPTHAPDPLLDAVALRDFDGSISSTTRTHGGVLGRASQAFDDDPGTAWRPIGATGEVQVRLPAPIRLEGLTIRREVGAEPALLRVEAGSTVQDVQLSGALTSFRFARPLRTEQLKLTVAAPGLLGQVAPIEDLRIDGVRTAPITGDTHLEGCAQIGSLDGAPVAVAVEGSLDAFLTAEPMTVDGCGEHRLAAGRHRYDAGLGWQVDQLLLRSPPGDDRASSGFHDGPGSVQILDRTRTSVRLAVTVSEPAVLSTGIAWDSRWRASIDGRPLGPPVVASGYAVGWEVPPGEHELTIHYGPQTALTVALIVTGGVVVLLGLVVALPPRRRL